MRILTIAAAASAAVAIWLAARVWHAGTDRATQSRPAGASRMAPTPRRAASRPFLPPLAPPATGASDLQEADEIKPSEARVIETIDADLVAQRIDPRWSQEVSVGVDGYFRSDRAAGSTLVRSDCRRSLCRLDVRHADPAAGERFVDDVSSFIPRDSTALIRPGRAIQTGPLATTVYVARAGYALPP